MVKTHAGVLPAALENTGEVEMSKKLIITVSRGQDCKICVEVPDDMTIPRMYHQDAQELANGLIGLDWETIGTSYEIEDVAEWSQEGDNECSGETEL